MATSQTQQGSGCVENMNRSIIKQIASAYAGFGKRPKGFNKNFFHYALTDWLSPVTSPIFLAENALPSQQDFKMLEKYFSSNPPKHKYEYKKPYFQILNSANHYDVNNIKKIATENGWFVSRTETLNIWSKKRPLEISDGFHLAVGHYFGSDLHKDARHVIRDYSNDAQYLHVLEKGISSIHRNTFLVVIYSKRGSPAAMCLVTFKKESAFLWVGIVAKRYRSKGLMRKLIASCQMVTSYCEVNFWITTTTHERVKNRGDENYEVLTFAKQEN